MADEIAPEAAPRPDRMQDFIFSRELAEVYLLLDYLSGRSNKSLAAAIGDGADDAGNAWIKKICAIGWPPRGTQTEQADQAATLLLAKDRLNSAAKPANGASIAFTLLVAGDDEAAALRKARRRKARRRWWAALFRRLKASDKSHSGNFQTAAAQVAPAPPPPPEGGPPHTGTEWDGEPPSRFSLARLAYPGLVTTASQFNWQIKAIILLLFIWLIFTCTLSWNIAAGQAILARLDGLETAKVAIQKRISDAEIEDVKRAALPDSAAPVAPGAAALPKPPILRYCDQPRLLPTKNSANGRERFQQFNDATQRQICDLLAENRVDYSNSREDLADWMAAWGWLKWSSHKFCGGRCLNDDSLAVPDYTINEKQWAAVLVQVLAIAVLPLCYGFLGAGAAVVRNIWGKMRDSLLSPRDLTLSLGQLALGAVIGACIGLFVTPNGANAQGAAGLTAAVTLTPSALSFIAGFGVEGVFVALESFIKRVFDIPDPKP